MRHGLAYFQATYLLLAACAAGARGDELIDFTRDIRPILQRHCTSCHGGVRREASLSLLAPGENGESGQALVVAGKPEASELYRRIIATDASERMPAENPPLAAGQIALIRRWIEAGATWPRHWSFTPLVRPQIPDVEGAASCNSPIDRFVLNRLEAADINPSPEADRYTLIRRLSVDLVGLPPNIADADDFAADRRPDAYERLVDRLLASPHFGERWGRHWLDLARYADSDGYEVDKPRPDAYRWRDWVIAAVNRDLPLERFTIEQFAGDLLDSATPDQRLATAYHRQTLTNNEGGVDAEEYRFKAVQDRVSNTATVWLGLTLGCAQCHDHPYDPVTQREFYSLTAIFNNADETEIELPGAKPTKVRVLSPRAEARTTRLLTRGEFLRPGDEVQPGALSALHGLTPRGDGAGPDRLDLARWLVDPANPLTPRVAVNQIWLKLFGQGLVRTPEDFGARGQPPTHPALLDWLAAELIECSTSRKTMIRRIAASAAYRQASHHRPEVERLDPDNRLLARQNRFRLEAEIVRDLQLAAGGLLTERIGGPSVFPPLSDEFIKITFRSQLPWKTSSGGDRYRRGMYTFFKRSVPYPDLMIFDCPDASSATPQRATTNTPLQALAALNSPSSQDAARGLARRMLDNSPGNAIELALRNCLIRPPTAWELARLEKLHHDHEAWYATHPEDARVLAGDLPATAAPWIATANILLNLDEFLTRP